MKSDGEWETVPEESGNQETMAAAAEVSRLGLALHFARRTYSNRFARIRTTKSQSEEDPGIYIGNACAGREKAGRRDNSVERKVEIMAAAHGNVVPPPRRRLLNRTFLKDVEIISFHRSVSLD